MPLDHRLSSLVTGTALAAALLFACGDEAGPEAGGGAAVGSGGETASTSASDASSSSAVASSSSISAASSGSGMSTFDCDPPAEPGSLYELSDIPMFPPMDPVSMCQYRGEVMLIFNAAAI